MTLIRSLCLAFCAATVRALHIDVNVTAAGGPRQPPRAHGKSTIILLGCSPDRYAVEWFCGKRETEMRMACADRSRDLALGYVFHPGVGLYGDMKPPFYNHSRYKIEEDNIITKPKKLQEHAEMLVGTKTPTMVVVDDSIWSLMVWASWQNTRVPEERVKQWCDHDLPNLMSFVSAGYPKSRVLFRTAPYYSDRAFEQRPWLDIQAVEYMYKCVETKSKEGRLFGKYPVIDYHAILDELVKQEPHSVGESTADYAARMWQNDGYHPSKVPARLFINEILKQLHIPGVEEADWDRTALGQLELLPAAVPKKEGDPEVVRG